MAITSKVAIHVIVYMLFQIAGAYSWAVNVSHDIPSGVYANYTQLIQQYKDSPHDNVLIVSVTRQRLYLIRDHQLLEQYIISTAKLGIGNVINTFKTPAGLHKISKKIGASAQAGAIFQKSLNTGCVYDIKLHIITTNNSHANCDLSNITDLITSRILQLVGLEQGVNLGTNSLGQFVDSRVRGIFIHGTNHEDTIGSITSHGCIRMKNFDVIDLFERIEINTLVLITE